MAHQWATIMQTLSNMLLVAKIEALFASMYMCFAHSLKKHLQHNKLTEIMETKGLKRFQNVKTWWVFFYTPPTPLTDSTMNPKGENSERTRSWGTFFGSQHLGGRGACWNSKMGTRKNDKKVNYSHGPAQTKQQVG
jgi:hypothetical protein